MRMSRNRSGLVVPLACALAVAVLSAGWASESVAAPAREAPAPQQRAQPIDINDAGETDLTKLPGVGPALAKRIVEFRKKHGPFRRVEDLLKIRGIGEKSFQKLRPHVKVGDER